MGQTVVEKITQHHLSGSRPPLLPCRAPAALPLAQAVDPGYRASLDLTHSPTPLILPTRGRKIVTVYDLFFLDFPDRADRQARTHFARRIASRWSMTPAPSSLIFSLSP